jgi:pyridoxal/pyridoxine/pyridoxamine kinase
LYIGYIANVAQVDAILEVAKEYRQYISCIITDPISGDHGKTYLPADVIRRLPELVKIADFAFPNLTELKLLTGHAPDSDFPTNDYLVDFRRMFPSTKLVVTSLSDDAASTGVLLAMADNLFHFEHELLSESFGGTGDAFLTYFIVFHFYDLVPVEEALQKAAEKIQERVMISIREKSFELIL